MARRNSAMRKLQSKNQIHYYYGKKYKACSRVAKELLNYRYPFSITWSHDDYLHFENGPLIPPHNDEGQNKTVEKYLSTVPSEFSITYDINKNTGSLIANLNSAYDDQYDDFYGKGVVVVCFKSTEYFTPTEPSNCIVDLNKEYTSTYLRAQHSFTRYLSVHLKVIYLNTCSEKKYNKRCTIVYDSNHGDNMGKVKFEPTIVPPPKKTLEIKENSSNTWRINDIFFTYMLLRFLQINEIGFLYGFYHSNFFIKRLGIITLMFKLDIIYLNTWEEKAVNFEVITIWSNAHINILLGFPRYAHIIRNILFWDRYCYSNTTKYLTASASVNRPKLKKQSSTTTMLIRDIFSESDYNSLYHIHTSANSIYSEAKSFMSMTSVETSYMITIRDSYYVEPKNANQAVQTCESTHSLIDILCKKNIYHIFYSHYQEFLDSNYWKELLSFAERARSKTIELYTGENMKRPPFYKTFLKYLGVTVVHTFFTSSSFMSA